MMWSLPADRIRSGWTGPERPEASAAHTGPGVGRWVRRMVPLHVVVITLDVGHALRWQDDIAD